MTREEALALVKKNLQNNNLIKHCLAVEAILKQLAKRFGENEDLWGLTGLLHDLDYQFTVNQPEKHTLVTEELLTPFNLDPRIIYAIKAHNLRVQPEAILDWALYATDPLSGLIVAAVLMHPEKKLQAMSVDFLMKRFKEKSFARGASREQIAECSRIGLTLDQFMQEALTGMRPIAAELGL